MEITKNDLRILENSNAVDGFYKIRDHYDVLWDNDLITDLWWWLIDGDDTFVDINKRKLVDACFSAFNDCNKSLKAYMLNHLDDYLINWIISGAVRLFLIKTI